MARRSKYNKRMARKMKRNVTKDESKQINFNSKDYCAGEINELNIGVFGSRTLADERVETIILEQLIEQKGTKIVTCQEPRGVSEVAQKVSKKYGYPLQLHFLNMRYLRGAFEQRSKEIIKECDYFIIIYDGKSQGTFNEKKLVEKSGKPYYYEELEISQYDRSVGFNIEQEWNPEVDNWENM